MNKLLLSESCVGDWDLSSLINYMITVDYYICCMYFPVFVTAMNSKRCARAHTCIVTAVCGVSVSLVECDCKWSTVSLLHSSPHVHAEHTHTFPCICSWRDGECPCTLFLLHLASHNTLFNSIHTLLVKWVPINLDDMAYCHQCHPIICA